jgi:apolipoprotein N-acyltransferase
MVVPSLLTLISALLYVLSFPPFSLSLLAWVALVPLFLVCSMVQPRPAAVYGLLWGVVMTCGFGWCFAEMVANFFGVSLAAGWLALFAVSLLLFGLYFGVFALWLSWMVRRQAASPFLVAAGWGLC